MMKATQDTRICDGKGMHTEVMYEWYSPLSKCPVCELLHLENKVKDLEEQLEYCEEELAKSKLKIEEMLEESANN